MVRDAGRTRGRLLARGPPDRAAFSPPGAAERARGLVATAKAGARAGGCGRGRSAGRWLQPGRSAGQWPPTRLSGVRRGLGGAGGGAPVVHAGGADAGRAVAALGRAPPRLLSLLLPAPRPGNIRGVLLERRASQETECRIRASESGPAWRWRMADPGGGRVCVRTCRSASVHADARRGATATDGRGRAPRSDSRAEPGPGG